MIALKYPFSIDINGSVAVTDDYAQIVQGQLVDVLMTNFNERIMRPGYGSNAQAMLFDPTEELDRKDAAAQVATRIRQWTARPILNSVEYTPDTHRETGRVYIDVVFRAGDFAASTNLRIPVSTFISEESPL